MVAACLIGCESVKTKHVIIDSNPPQAVVIVEGREVGQTPITQDLKFKNTRKDRYLIVIKKKGFEPQERWLYYRDNDNVLFDLNKLDQ